MRFFDVVFFVVINRKLDNIAQNRLKTRASARSRHVNPQRVRSRQTGVTLRETPKKSKFVLFRRANHNGSIILLWTLRILDEGFLHSIQLETHVSAGLFISNPIRE